MLSPALQWSPAATERLETWLARRCGEADLFGADPREVAEDLRAHVHEELTARGVQTVDLAALEAVLAGMDRPGERTARAMPDDFPPRRLASMEKAAEKPKRKPGFRFPKVFLWFGVIWPTITILAERLFGLCAGEFFDPVPSVWHLLLALTVPACLLLAYRVIQRKRQDRWHLARAATGAALVIASFYVLAFGMLNVMALMGIVLVFLVPLALPLPWMTLAPALSALAALAAALRLRKIAPPEADRRGLLQRRPWLMGAAVGALAIGAIELPRWYTIDRMLVAQSGDEKRAADAIASLRRWGVRSILHDACFREGSAIGGSADISYWIYHNGPLNVESTRVPLSAADARAAFYRVTGKAFTEVKPRRNRSQFFRTPRLGISRTAETNWVFDAERGGDTVGARLPGLSLAQSSAEWNVEGPSRLGYGEWTFVFQNEHANPQEARAQIKLPPGACVSRLTLWVNGEPQEAAFAATPRVKAAYKQVVTVEQRDPVLVTQVGPDTVMMQCFPVPSNGKMKVRLGITAPLDAEGQLWMPEIIERNFMMGESGKTHLWVQSRTAFDGPSVGTVANGSKGERTWQAAVALNGDPLSFRWNGHSTEPFWSQDPLSATDQERVVTGRWEMTPSNAKPVVAVVIDGSAPLRPHLAAIADALKAASAKGPVRAWISTDEGARELDPSVPLTDDDFTGGRPALPSLVMAMTHASSVSGGAGILWLRGPQPAEIEGDEAAMEQIMRFSLNPPVIFSVPVVEGAHRLMEKLYRHTNRLRSAPRVADPGKNLAGVVERCLAGSPQPHLVFQRQAAPPPSGTEVSDQLARHAAFLDLMAAFGHSAPVPQALLDRTARHQLVTPLTGAVVLETKQQFDQNGLSQVDPSSVPKVPTIPEPATAILLVTATALGLRRRRAVEPKKENEKVKA